MRGSGRLTAAFGLLLLAAWATAQCDAAPCSSCTTAQTARDLQCTGCVSPSEISGLNCSQVQACLPTVTTTIPAGAATTTSVPSSGPLVVPQLQIGGVPGLDMQKPLASCLYGDNEKSCFVVRSVYGNPDEQWWAVNSGPNHGPTMYARAQTGAPVGFYGTPTLGSASTTAPTFTDAPGTIPSGYALYAAVAWENGLLGGETAEGAWGCRNVTTGGVTIGYPQTWPSPFSQAPVLGLVYFALDPHPCPTGAVKPPFSVLLDILQRPTQHLTVAVLDMPEHQSPSYLNYTGPELLGAHDSMNFPTWAAGLATQVDWPMEPPSPNGWIYLLWGFNCSQDTLSDGTVVDCVRCDRHRGVTVTLGSQPPPKWETRTVPFSDPQRVCYRRGQVAHASAVITVPQGGTRGLVVLRPRADGSGVDQQVIIP